MKTLLVIFQYASISVSGILGLSGLLFDYKDKDSRKFTRMGKFAFVVLIISFAVGLISKTIELQIQRSSGETEEKKARLASEQTLKIVSNVERVANAVQEVHIRMILSIPIQSAVFEDFREQIYKRLGISGSDQDLSEEEFRNLIHTERWKTIADDLLRPSPFIVIYPKYADIPNCIASIDDSSQLSFNIPFEVESIAYPQFGTEFQIEFEGKVEPHKTKRPQVMSLMDFNEGTAIIYMFIPVAETQTPPNVPDVSQIANRRIQFEKEFPLTAWQTRQLDFSFDGNRRVYTGELELKHDKCNDYPYFVTHISPNNLERNLNYFLFNRENYNPLKILKASR